MSQQQYDPGTVERDQAEDLDIEELVGEETTSDVDLDPATFEEVDD